MPHQHDQTRTYRVPPTSPLEKARDYAESNEHQAAQTWAAIASAEALHEMARTKVAFQPGAIHIHARPGHNAETIARDVTRQIEAGSCTAQRVDGNGTPQARMRVVSVDPNDESLGAALGISENRWRELDQWMMGLVKAGATPSQVVVAMNERGDLTEAEWTSVMYGLGWYMKYND